MERTRYIRVPKDKRAQQDYDYGVQEQERMEELLLSEEQYQKLCNIGFFDKINKKCGIIIDDYEEEVLELDKIPLAREVIIQLLEENENEVLLKLKEILDLAVEYQTLVGFDF